MKQRITALVLALLLCFSCFPAAQAAAAADMTDISGHWAEEDIAWVLEQSLYMGTTATTFSPNSNMTRAMFITVLGRFAGLDPQQYMDWYLPYLYTDIDADAYYAPYVNWASRYGVTSGTAAGKFAPHNNITREQMAVFMVRYADLFGYTITAASEDVVDAFTDADQVSNFARDAVERMRLSGLLKGRSNGDGTYRFDPSANATRAECAALFHRLSGAMVPDPYAYTVEPTGIELSMNEVRVCPGDQYRLYAWIEPYDVTNDRITWFSTDPSVLLVDSKGLITVLGEGAADIYAVTCNGLYAMCSFTSGDYIGYAGEGYTSKCIHVFGEYVDNPRKPYGPDAPKETYLANMVTVKVKVWDFKNGIGSEKVTKTRSFQVHKNLALTAQMIFEEIYACEAQYPIEDIVTYWSASGNSEHCPGLAIDVNPNSNPYVRNGVVEVGEAFDPENDPYSMPIDGEVQQIFEKYGFFRGIYWGSSIDYMHYSFFGT